MATLSSKDISGTWFIVFFHLDMWFPPISDFLTWKSINDTYIVAVYTLNTPSTPYFFFYNCEKRNFYLSSSPLAFKTSIVLFLISKPVNMLRSIFFVLCLLLNMSFLLFFEVQLLIASVAPTLLDFNLEKYHLYFPVSFQTTVHLLYCLFRGL